MISSRLIVSHVLALVALMTACKGSSAPDPVPPAPPAAPDEVEQTDTASGSTQEAPDHGPPGETGASVPADLRAFQELFEQSWRMEPGKVRADHVCGYDVFEPLKEAAFVIDRQSSPSGVDEKAWHAAVARMRDYVNSIGAYCDDADTEYVEEYLTKSHEALEAVLAMLSGGSPD